jgi:osmotically inducible protein OsmC
VPRMMTASGAAKLQERNNSAGAQVAVSNSHARTSQAEKGASVPAKGSAEWKGDVPTGAGTFTAGDTISGGYTYKSRFEDGPGSNPEQLIAAAHAACFSMALSSILAKSGNAPESVHTDATVTLRLVDGLPTITKIALVTVGHVPGLDESVFVEHAQEAKAGCPVSRALAGVPEITLEARLAP